MRQIFGWTYPKSPEQGAIGYTAANIDEDGLLLTVRQHGGGAGDALKIPHLQAIELAISILKQYAHERLVVEFAALVIQNTKPAKPKRPTTGPLPPKED